MYPRKRFAALLLCAVMLFASAGCKEKTKTDSGSKKPSSSQNSGTDSVSSDSSDSSDQSSDVSSDGTLSTDSRGNLSDDITSSDSDNGYHTDRAIPTDSGNGNSGGRPSMGSFPGSTGSTSSAASAKNLILYGVSLLVFIAAMLFAVLYRRRPRKR